MGDHQESGGRVIGEMWKWWENIKSENNNFETMADKEVVEMGLTVAGIFALVDPLRDGIAKSV